MGDRIAPLHFTSLEVRGVDAGGNPLSVSDWMVRRFDLEERLSEPYSLMLSLVIRDRELYVPGLVGGRCRFQFGRDDFERQVHGVVIKADTVGQTRDGLRVQLWVGPSLELLSLSRRLRIFQGKTAAEIFAEILAPVLEQYGGAIDTSGLDEYQFRYRDHCVQHDETDLAFAQRILAEDGIVFSFRHEADDAETVALAFATASLHSASGEDEQAPRLTQICPHDPDTADEETIRGLKGSTRMRLASSTVSMWDWKSPSPATSSIAYEPFAEDKHEPPSLARFGETHEHESYRPDEQDDGVLLFPIWWEAEANGHRARHNDALATGTGNIVGFTDGATFEVDHPTEHLEGQYAILSVSHHAVFHDEDGVAEGQTASYHNRFLCHRYDKLAEKGVVTFAPPRRAKPRAHGPVTAIVVGPEGEEIYTDEYGRIKVRMHWDREGAVRGDHETSCWVPVGQLWAGPGYGAVFMPRVGMEVVISFIAGDPDRPLCTGVVYNGLNQHPYPLPDSKTRTVFKTSSSPGGNGYNELSFEDAAGSEEVFLHAQKNLRQVVRASETASIGGSRSRTIGKDDTVAVGGDRKTTIAGSTASEIQGARSIEVLCQADGGADSLTVEGVREQEIRDRWNLVVGSSASVDAVPDKIQLKAPQEIVLEVGSTALRLTPDALVIAASTIQLEASGASLGLANEIVATAVNKVELSQAAGSCRVVLAAGGMTTESTAAATFRCAMGGSLEIDGGVAARGGAVQLAAATATVSITATDVTTTAATIQTNATGIHTITGMPIRLN